MKLDILEPDEEVEINMSPMIDMVFLLIIFFLVASTLLEKKIKVVLPSANYARVPENIKGRLVITVTADEKVYVGMTPVTLDELEERISAELDANPKLKIQIRADANSRYKFNEKIIKLCGKVGAVHMIYSAYEETLPGEKKK